MPTLECKRCGKRFDTERLNVFRCPACATVVSYRWAWVVLIAIVALGVIIALIKLTR